MARKSPQRRQAVNPDLRWYVVHAYSGMEKAVERNIRERINRAGMQHMFGASSYPLKKWWR
jgi:transcriptional antiterminator NusG